MAYTNVTIQHALTNILENRWVLPAIQRELVWRQRQITRLFDSLMRGYPIGSFLFWRVNGDNINEYQFYQFMLDYHQKYNRHLRPLGKIVYRDTLVAVLDGQQRLTSLNIGLRGSYAQKLPRVWWKFDSSFPKKQLYLNLSRRLEDNDDGMEFDFRFLTSHEAERNYSNSVWYPVGDITNKPDSFELMASVQQAGIQDQQFAFNALNTLDRIVHTAPVISYYEEQSQDIDKVLDIFIRTNSAGTPLAQSDLLFSIAVANWDKLDAREAIYDKVDEINSIGDGFNFSKDQLLRAGLLLTDVPNIRLRVANFNRGNMLTLQDNWHRITEAFKDAVDLVDSLGYSRQNLVSHNAVLPIAYYIYLWQPGTDALTDWGKGQDRDKIRLWLARTFLRSGIWRYGVDSLLVAIRRVIREHGQNGFPLDQLRKAMSDRGRSIEFDEEDLQDIVETDYGVFTALTLIFPFQDISTNKFHIDHVFPLNRLSSDNLRKHEMSEEEIDEIRHRANRLPNFQLLIGPENISKSDRMPADWVNSQFSDDDARQAYLDRHLLGELPADVTGFVDWYEARRERMQERLREILGV